MSNETDLRCELSEMNRTLQNLHEYASNFEHLEEHAHDISKTLDRIETSVYRAVCSIQRIAAISAVDAQLRCPWTMVPKESLVDHLRRLTLACMAEAFDDVDV